ncbi:MAG: hypothetical protein PHC51_01040 [bacterium]|nr:hypothetical protein [bacterium]
MFDSALDSSTAERSFLMQSLLYFLEETSGSPNCYMRKRSQELLKQSSEVRDQLLEHLGTGRYLPTTLRNIGFAFACCFREHQPTRKWMLERLYQDERPVVLFMLLTALRDIQSSEDMIPAMRRVYEYLNCSDLEGGDVNWNNCFVPNCVISDSKLDDLLRRYAYLVTRRYYCGV